MTLAQLRQAAELLPPGASVTLTREALLELTAGVEPGPGSSGATGQPAGDLSVADLAARFQRSPSTIRGWLEAGRFPGAYKLSGRDWRVPVSGVEAFVALERRQAAPRADLGTWRKHRRPA